MYTKIFEETWEFYGIFGKISNEMLILIHTPSYKHMFFSKIFVIGKIRIMEYHQLSIYQ